MAANVAMTFAAEAAVPWVRGHENRLLTRADARE
jgi:hypothetical protein